MRSRLRVCVCTYMIPHIRMYVLRYANVVLFLLLSLLYVVCTYENVLYGECIGLNNLWGNKISSDLLKFYQGEKTEHRN